MIVVNSWYWQADLEWLSSQNFPRPQQLSQYKKGSHEDIKRIPVEFHIVVVKEGVTAMTVPLCCS